MSLVLSVLRECVVHYLHLVPFTASKNEYVPLLLTSALLMIKTGPGKRSKQPVRGRVDSRTVLLDDPNNSYGVGRRIISV